MKKKILIILGIIICLFGIFKFSHSIIIKYSAKDISNSEMSTLLTRDNIIHQVPRMPHVYNITYHIDNKKRIVYIIPRSPYELKDEMDDLRTTPVGTSNLNDTTKSEKQFAFLSTQVAKRYGKIWKVQVLNTYDPVFDDLHKSDILWQFQNGKEKGNGSQSRLFKLERIILTPFDYLTGLFSIIILFVIVRFFFSLVGSGPSSNKSHYATNKWHQSSYGSVDNDKSDDYVTETHYDQYGDAHSVRFKKGDYSRGSDGGQTFNMNPDGSYDSDDGNTHFDK